MPLRKTLLQISLLLAPALAWAQTATQPSLQPQPTRPPLTVGYAPEHPRFHVIALAEGGSQHGAFVEAAKLWLNQLAADNNFAIDYISNTKLIDDAFLSMYQVFIHLNYPPFSWTSVASAAFQRYIGEGRGGWIGFHHATLLGEYEHQPMWVWFHDFMGGIRFKGYIASLASGQVTVEDAMHPAMRGVPKTFTVDHDEWYTYDQSPRPNVRVLATVDESTYQPTSDVKMGDHPIIWTNEHVKARNIYYQIGHSPDLMQNPAFLTIFKNSILWAANQ